MTPIIILVTFVLAGILNIISEFEKVRLTRFIFIFVSSVLFFITGVLTGIYYQ